MDSIHDKTISLLQTTIETLADAASAAENKRCSPDQFTKFLSLLGTKPLVLKDTSTGEALAGCILILDYPTEEYAYVNEIQAFKKGYGRILIDMLLDMYPKLWLIKSWRAGPTLLDYYKSIPRLQHYQMKTRKGSAIDMFCTKACDETLIVDSAVF